MSTFFVPTNESVAELVTDAINNYWADYNLKPTVLYVGREMHHILLRYPNMQFFIKENGKRVFMDIVVIDYDPTYLRVHA